MPDTMQIIRYCVVCGKSLQPFSEFTLTAHEYECYKKRPDKVPEMHREQFKDTLAWEKRSNSARQAVARRRGEKYFRKVDRTWHKVPE